MGIYRCAGCGYTYESKEGDMDSGVKPGTPFEELVGGWTCPVCGVDTSKFEKED